MQAAGCPILKCTGFLSLPKTRWFCGVTTCFNTIVCTSWALWVLVTQLNRAGCSIATQEELENGESSMFWGKKKRYIGNASYLSRNSRGLHKIKSIFEGLQRGLHTEHRAGSSMWRDSIQLTKAGKSKETVCLRVVIIRPQNSLPRENCWNCQYSAHLKSH